MSRFVQLHVLTNYPPANLNRDDLGRPKTALLGDSLRLRVSSQSLKRAWRTSEAFAEAMSGHIGTRTKRIGLEVRDRLVNKGLDEKKAKKFATLIAKQFGKSKAANKDAPDNELEIEQLAHIGPTEWAAIDDLVERLANSAEEPSKEELALLRKPIQAVDIAMFGRMLADSPSFNVEAAVQVAHSITVHRSAVEDDYFTAVDDLNREGDDSGASHIGERGFGAGLFYQYICIDRTLLVENLGDQADLADGAVGALVRAACTVGPSGMQASFASRAYATYLHIEKGDQQPRSLVEAFVKPVLGGEAGITATAIATLESQLKAFDRVYGKCADTRYHFNLAAESGTLDEAIEFVAGE